MVTKGTPKGAALKFLRWVTSGKKAVTTSSTRSWIADPLTQVTGGACTLCVRAPGAAGDRRAELMLGALGVFVLVVIGGDGRDGRDQSLALLLLQRPALVRFRRRSRHRAAGDARTEPLPGHGILYFTAWPLIWATPVTTIGAVVLALVISTFAAVFLTEFAPAPSAGRSIR